MRTHIAFSFAAAFLLALLPATSFAQGASSAPAIPKASANEKDPASPYPKPKKPVVITPDDTGSCKTCVNTVLQVKKNSMAVLPAICSGLYVTNPEAYQTCTEVTQAISKKPESEAWLFDGCYKYEVYQEKEWVKPCPSHMICTVLKDLNNEPFCPPVDMEDPFENDK